MPPHHGPNCTINSEIHISPMTKYEYDKRYKKRRRLRGLCVDCGRKRNSGKWKCDACMRKRNLRRMELYPLYCGECKKIIRPEERDGRSLHAHCAKKREARLYPPMHRLAALAYQRRHREKGLCNCCPRKVFKGGLCRRHYGMGRMRELERQAS